MVFSRDRLNVDRVQTCMAIQKIKPGRTVQVAGLVLRHHKPPNAGGTVFFTLEDKIGLAQVTVSPDTYRAIGADL